jgi:hypothetical protein
VFAALQDTRKNPSDVSGLPLLREHFAFVALRSMLSSLSSSPKFCERLVHFQEHLKADPEILAAVMAAHAASHEQDIGSPAKVMDAASSEGVATVGATEAPGSHDTTV